MTSLLPPAKKKKRCFNEQYKHKFPVPIASETGVPVASKAWHYYKAVWDGNKIIVPDPHHGEALWNNGYFGVGDLSSSGMNYAANCDIVTEKRLCRKIEWQTSSQNGNTVYSDDDDGIEEYKDLLVIDNKGESDVSAKFENDPFPIKENMFLTTEEALYLSYALGCLVVSTKSGKELDVDDLWTEFTRCDKYFFLRYIAYHYLKSKGWVVKPGTKFGVDWIVYPNGPPLYHSQFLLVTRCVWQDSLETDTTYSHNYTMTDICAFERLSNHVTKSVVLCDIIRPREESDDYLKHIDCLKKIKVVFSHVIKWEPEATMDDAKSS